MNEDACATPCDGLVGNCASQLQESITGSQLTSRTARSRGPVTKAAVSGHRASPYTVTLTSSPLVSRTAANSNRNTPFIVTEVTTLTTRKVSKETVHYFVLDNLSY